MRLVHLSDLHLGYRQYLRLTPTGINQREADVARTFQRAIDQVIALEPDIVVIAGDVFHNARPTNAAILHSFRQFLRLRNALSKAAIVLIGGDHDTPRTTETGSILSLFEQLGISVAAGEARRFPFPDKDLSILAVPGVPNAAPSLLPSEDARRNVLLIHANVQDVVPRFQAEIDRAALQLSRADLSAPRWDYVALGHYHVHQQVADNAWYAGSIDFTSLDVWGDLELAGTAGKGFIEFDLEAGTHQFHRVPPSREFVDLKAINARNLSVAEIDAAIRRAVEKCKGGIDDKVVRLIVRDIPRHVVRELDHRALREYKQRALHFHLVPHRPEPLPRAGQGAPARRPSVVDVVREQLRTRELSPDIDRERLVELGMKYLADAETVPATGVSLEPEGES